MATTWQRCSSFPRPCRTVFRLRSRDGRMPRWMARLRPTPTDPSRSFPTCRRRRSLPPPTGQRTRGTTRYLGVFPFSSLPLHSSIILRKSFSFLVRQTRRRGLLRKLFYISPTSCLLIFLNNIHPISLFICSLSPPCLTIST